MPDNKILIADDEEANLKMLIKWLVLDGYEIVTAHNGEEAVRKAKLFRPDLVILDIMMPVMDGFEACKLIKSDLAKNTPVIMVTALHDRASKLQGLTVGANEFLTKPIDRAELILRIRNLLKIKSYEDFILRHNQILEEEVREKTYNICKMNNEMVQKLTAAAEFRDEDTGAHIARIGRYSHVLATTMDLPPDVVDTVSFASQLHDIGKIGIPDGILLKPGALTQEELDVMRSHTEIGYKILSGSTFPRIRMAASIARNHHERWDGEGYPNRLKGEDIAIEARIVALADVYDALRCERPYKPAFSHAEAVGMMVEGDDRTMLGHFDPDVLRAFTEIASQFKEIFADNKPQVGQ